MIQLENRYFVYESEEEALEAGFRRQETTVRRLLDYIEVSGVDLNAPVYIARAAEDGKTLYLETVYACGTDDNGALMLDGVSCLSIQPDLTTSDRFPRRHLHIGQNDGRAVVFVDGPTPER